MFCSAYFLYDIFLMWYVLQNRSTFAYQSIAHHIMTNFGTLLLTAYGGHTIPLISAVSYLCETSMVFYNFRTMLGKASESPLAVVNALCFALTYTVSRIIMWPFLIYTFYKSKETYDFEAESPEHRFTFWFVLILCNLVYLINWIWYLQILDGFNDKICKKKSKKTKKIE